MKIAVVSLTCLLLMGSIGQAVERKVVGEYFTNYHPIFQPADSTLDSILTLYQNDLVLIRYHVWWPESNDPFYLYNSSEIGTRNSYLGNTYIPHLFLDGPVDADGQYYNNFGRWNDSISAELQRNSPLIISTVGQFDSVSHQGTIHITVIAVDSISEQNLKLRIALTESGLQSYGRTHNQTFRDMMPNTNGYPFSIQLGDTIYYDQDFSCPSPLVPQNCDLITFVQSDVSKHILQGNMVSITALMYQTCPYIPGDINGNGSVNGVDIVYAVNYFKGGPNHPPVDCFPGCPNEPNPFYAAGDVNGNCAFNGVDITFFVRYLKGQVPSLLYCTDCPPAG